MARVQRPTLRGTLLGLAALGFACALPPQNEELPLTGALEKGPRVDAATGPAEDIESVAVAGVSAPEERGQGPLAQGAVGDGSGGDSTATSAEPAETQGAAAGPDARTEEPNSAVDLQAIERDGEAEFPPAVESDIVLAAADGSGMSGTAIAGGPTEATEPVSFRLRGVEAIDGLRMVYRVGGQGPPVVLIHGWCGNAAQWDDHADALAATHRVYAVDLPGHGESRDQIRETWSIPTFGADIARLIEEEELQDVVLVGHAMGGQVALEAAGRAPGRVAAIIGVDSLQRLGVDPNPERLEPYIASFAQDYASSMEDFIGTAVHRDTGPGVRRRILDDALACSPEMAVALMGHFGLHDPKSAARTIDCRVICINSDAAPTDVEGNRTLLTSFDAVIMNDVGHWPHLEASQRFLSRLQEELVRVGPRAIEDEVGVLQSLSPVLYCSDVAAVRDFYVEGLHFEEVDRRPRDESRTPDFVALSRDGATVMVQSLATLRSDLPEVSVRPRDGILFLRVSNLDEELMRMGEGVTVAVPERRLSSGSRQIVVKDPAGTFVVLQQAPVLPAR